MTARWHRIKNALYARLMEAPMTAKEHADQRARVLASTLRPDKPTDAHSVYPVRRSTGGWTNGPVIRTTVAREPRR